MTEDEVLDTGALPEASELAPAPEPDPEPTQPVEVISVDELMERLTAAEAEEPEPTEEVVEPVEQPPLEIVGMDGLLSRLETLQLTVDHPALETPFEEYTVTEGLLLLLLVLVIVSWCVKMIKGGFSWLLW